MTTVNATLNLEDWAEQKLAKVALRCGETKKQVAWELIIDGIESRYLKLERADRSID